MRGEMLNLNVQLLSRGSTASQINSAPVGDKLQPGEGEVGDPQGLKLEEGSSDGGQHGEAQLVSWVRRRQLGDEADEDAEKGLGGEGLPQHVSRPLEVACNGAQRPAQQWCPSPMCCRPKQSRSGMRRSPLVPHTYTPR